MDSTNQEFSALLKKIEENKEQQANWLKKRGLSKMDREDVLQEASLRMITHIKDKKYVEEGKGMAYYASIVRNIYFERYRQQKRGQKLNSIFSAQQYLVADEKMEADIQIIKREAYLQSLYHAFKKLNSKEKLLLQRKYKQGMSAPAIAKLEGVQPNTINQRMSACKKKLKKIMNEGLNTTIMSAQEEKIERYIQKKMSFEEEEAFEIEMKLDRELFEEIKFSAGLLFVIRNERFFELGDSSGTKPNHVDTALPGSIANSSFILKITAAALSISFMAVIYYFSFPNQKQETIKIGKTALQKKEPAFVISQATYDNLESLYEVGKYDQVIDSMIEIKQGMPSCWFCDLQIAYCNLMNGNIMEASRQLEKQMQDQDKFETDLPYFYAISLLLQGEKNAATSELEKLLEKIGDSESYLRYDTEELLEELIK